MAYLTPQRFREMGYGVELPEEDAELAALIAQASAVVDSYCNVPRIPQMHSFRGGAITGEEHVWRMPVGWFEIGQRRFYPFHWPILSVEQFRIQITNSQYLEVAPTSLMINNSERYFEIISLALTSVGLFGALGPIISLTVPVARANYTYGWDFTSTDELLTSSDGYTWRAQNQFWFTDTDRLAVVSVNGGVQPSGYTVDATEGTVVFNNMLAATDTVSATYHYKLPENIQYGTAEIVSFLRIRSTVNARGLAGLSSLRVAEVEIGSPRGRAVGVAQALDTLVPEAAVLLADFKADNITVRG